MGTVLSGYIQGNYRNHYLIPAYTLYIKKPDKNPLHKILDTGFLACLYNFYIKPL